MTDTKKENRIVFICWLAYMVAYIGRLNFSASIVAIISDTGLTKAAVGIVTTFFFFAYGIGQLVNGILSKHYNGRIMVFISLMISSVLNFAIPMCGNNVSVMKYIWLLNGAVQSILWCTLIKTISEFVSDKGMPRAIFVMSTTNTVGTFAVYGMSAFFVRFASWRITFFVASGLLVITAIVWFIGYGNEKPPIVLKKDLEEKSSVRHSGVMIACIAMICLAGIANGFIKDGVNTWVPSVLNEEFGVTESLSILLTFLLPLMSTLSAGLIRKIHETVKSHSLMNTMLYGVTALLCGGIIFFFGKGNVVFIMVCFIMTSAVMAMVNNVITSMFPLDRRKLMGSGFAAGLLNTFCYVGSTITSYTLGAVADKRGWNTVFIIMLCVSIAAFAVSAVGSIFDRKVNRITE